MRLSGCFCYLVFGIFLPFQLDFRQESVLYNTCTLDQRFPSTVDKGQVSMLMLSVAPDTADN